MPRTCSACDHAQLDAVNHALVDSASDPKRFRILSARFGLSPQALRRHADAHLTAGLARATVRHAELVEETRDMDVLAALGRLVAKAERLLSATDEWLTDPNDPSRYTLAPRTEEYLVVVEETVGDRSVRRTERLNDLLRAVEKGTGLTVAKAEAKTADPRKLHLDAIVALRPTLETIGKALGQIKPDPAATVNVLALPETKAHLARVAAAFEACAAAGCTRCGDAWESRT